MITDFFLKNDIITCVNQPTTNFQHPYYHLVSLELRHTLDLLKPHLPKEYFTQLETYLGAAEYGIVTEHLIERFAYSDVEMPEEARIQLGILAKVLKIDIDILVDPGSSAQ